MKWSNIINNLPIGCWGWRSMVFYHLVLSIFCSSCRKFVQIDAPSNSLVTGSVFTSDATAIASLTSIYSLMVDENNMPYLIPELTGLTGDELVTYSSFLGKNQAYTNSLNPQDASTNSIWALGYKCIYSANAVYEGCNNSVQLSNAVKTQLMGEAMFIRAFWHLYLVNLYGDVPVVASTDYRVNGVLKRSPTDAVYQQIISDLEQAQALLNEGYVTGNTRETGVDRVRPNKSTAAALLSRAYLYSKNYQKAELLASQVINTPLYDTVSVNEVFVKNSKEAIWQLMKPEPINDVNTWEGAYFILNEPPTSSWNNSSAFNSNFIESFEASDLRMDKWIGRIIDSTNGQSIEYYFPFKYKVQNSTDVTEYSTVLRLSEQYLIRAEARAQVGNLQDAMKDLDIIRKRARLPLFEATRPSMGREELLNAIFKERQHELFTEWGHRWLDMKRTGRINSVMRQVAPSKGSNWNEYMQYWPLPLTELQNNPSLSQNPGYN